MNRKTPQSFQLNIIIQDTCDGRAQLGTCVDATKLGITRTAGRSLGDVLNLTFKAKPRINIQTALVGRNSKRNPRVTQFCLDANLTDNTSFTYVQYFHRK